MKRFFSLLLGIASLVPVLPVSHAQTPASEGTQLLAPPYIRPETARLVAEGVWVIPDLRTRFVPNIGIVEGRNAILVVDVGMGPRNGQLLWEHARKVAGQRRIYFTSTHFHPEHNFGASAFDLATIILNRAQAEELKEKGEDYLKLFKGFGAVERKALEGTILAKPGLTYSGSMHLDLGGRTVELREMPAHTRGDQVVIVEDSRVVFMGDLLENRFFPIMPDADAKGAQWIGVFDKVLALKPAIVVPGHGEVSDITLVQTVRSYLVDVQREVNARAKRGMAQDAIIKELTPRLAALHPDWDEALWIPYQIAIFYSEATGKPVSLPDLTKDLQR